MASASLTARFVRRSSRSLTSPKVACAHCSGDITASQFSIPLSSLLLRFLLLPRFYHFFTRTLRVRVRAKSSGPNPAVQGWYVWFLQHLVQPNAGLWSFLLTYGEFAVGLGVLLGLLTGIAAGFGVLMNLNYLLAGTVSINPVLGMFGLFLCFSWRVCGWIGLDRWVLPALGLPWKPGTLFQPQAVST
jgi:uncharacterized membrane protein YphA (DoxX/SURF4 family)